MRLLRARLVRVPPFSDVELAFGPEGEARAVTVVVGSGGTGKTALAQALASTRPGYAVAQPRGRAKPELAPFVVTHWQLGDDDPARPHPLVVASPSAAIDPDEASALARRREQALFDKLTERGGYAFSAFSAARWFSRSPIVLTQPERSFLRHDPRQAFAFDDATRADLGRETKQVLAYAEIAGALGQPELRDAVRAAVAEILPLFDLEAAGIDPTTLEPMFRTHDGDVAFDELPQAVRQAIALPALALRAVRSSSPTGDPREKEGVFVVDEAALGLPPHVATELPMALARALPKAQWILLTASQDLARGVAPDAVVALRREAPKGPVDVHTGTASILH